jgi:iron complex transport system permease protein
LERRERLSAGVQRIWTGAGVLARKLAASKLLPAPALRARRIASVSIEATDEDKSESKSTKQGTVSPEVSRGTTFTFILLVLTFVVAVVSLSIGRYPIPLGDVIRILASRVISIPQQWPDIYNTVVIQIRLPRILADMLVGGSLAIAGASLQGLFRNPLVSPDILGVSSGAAVGAALAILLALATVMIQVLAFVFALAAVGLTYFMSRQVKGNPTLSLILAGIAIASFFNATLSLLEYLSNPQNQLPAIVYWLMGSFNAVTMSELKIAAIPMLAGITILLLVRWRINVVAMGEEEAMALGINTNKLRAVIIICASVVTAAGVCISGTIGWVGLVIPHIGRMIVGPNHKVLLPVSVLLGAAYLLIIDDIVRTAAAVEIPIGILTAMVGAPFFLYLLRKGKWGWV